MQVIVSEIERCPEKIVHIFLNHIFNLEKRFDKDTLSFFFVSIFPTPAEESY